MRMSLNADDDDEDWDDDDWDDEDESMIRMMRMMTLIASKDDDEDDGDIRCGQTHRPEMVDFEKFELNNDPCFTEKKKINT